MESDKRRYAFVNWFFNRPRTTGLIAFVLVSAMSMYIVYQRHKLNRDNYSREMNNLLEVAYSNLDQALKNASNTALTLALTINDDGKPKNFEAVGRQLVESNRGVDAVQLVPGGRIRYVYPLKGNEAALGYDILSDSVHRPDLLKTIQLGRMYFSGPFELRQGGQGIVGRLPVYLDNRFWGFSAVVIRLETMLNDTGMDAIDDSRYSFQISGIDPIKGQEVFLLPTPHTFKNRLYRQKSIPETSWTLYIIDNETPFERLLPLLPLVAFSLIFSALFGFVITLLLKKPQHLRAQVRKQAQKIVESESKFRSMFEQAAVGIASIDSVTGKILEANEALSGMTGYSADALANMIFIDLFHPSETDKDARMKMLRAGQITEFSVERRLQRPSGEAFWVKLTVSPLWKPGETPTSHIAIVQDITFEKEARDLIVKSEERFKSLFQDSPLGLWEEDFSDVIKYLKGFEIPTDFNQALTYFEAHPDIVAEAARRVKIIDINNRCVELHAPRTREELLCGLEPLLDDGNIEVFHSQLAAMVSGVPRFVTETKIRKPNGEEFDMSLGWTVMRGHEDSFDRVVVFTDDITQQKAAQQIIVNSRQRLENLLNTIEGIVWECNSETLDLHFISAKTEQILGYTPTQWLSEEFFWREHLHPDDRERAIEKFLNIAKSKQDGVIEYRFLAADGRVVWIRDSLSIVSEDGRNVLRGIMIDVTANKEAEQTTQQSLKLVNEHRKRLMNFSYIVSHNLRSHAANIQSISQFLDMGEKCNDEQAEMIAMLKTVSETLNETMLNLNDLVNLQTNDNLSLEELNLAEYINNAIELLTSQIEASNAHVEIDVPADVEVRYNAAYLESILHNLISNALRYRSPDRKPEIVVKWTSNANERKLSVSDNGVGIDLNRHGDKLFGMYKTFAGNPDARGIGLFMTKSQIESMDGTIAVESQVGVGTTFTITFGEPYKNTP